MSDFRPSDPILVNANPLPALATMVVRSVLLAAAGGLIADGTLDAETVQTVAGGLVAAVTIGWGVFLNIRNTREKTRMAQVAPDSVAQVK